MAKKHSSFYDLHSVTVSNTRKDLSSGKKAKSMTPEEFVELGCKCTG